MHTDLAQLQHIAVIRNFQRGQSVLLHHEDGRPLGSDGLEGLKNILNDQRSQTQGGFIQQQNLRVRHQRPANGQHLLLTAGEGSRLLTPPLLQNVRVVDSRNLSTGQGLVVLKACELAKTTESLDQLKADLDAFTSRVEASFVLDKLEYMVKGALLQKTVERACALGAEPAVFTFDRPPKEVVTGQPVYLINSPEDRQALIRRLYGIGRIILAPFDHEMMTMSWEDFVTELLVKRYGAVHLVAGHDHRFGHKNAGNAQLLQKKCAQLGLGCDIIPEVVHDGITVSSTYIRTLIEAGDVERAAEFLGHRHCLSRTVEHGQRIGRTIGIPTVNLTMPPRVLVPAHGVYITRVYLPDGRSFAGVTNVGTRPTVSDSDAVSVETFLLDFDGDLYGQSIRLDFCRRLRGEQKFDSLEALRQGIQQNIAQTRTYFRGEA